VNDGHGRSQHYSDVSAREKQKRGALLQVVLRSYLIMVVDVWPVGLLFLLSQRGWRGGRDAESLFDEVVRATGCLSLLIPPPPSPFRAKMQPAKPFPPLKDNDDEVPPRQSQRCLGVRICYSPLPRYTHFSYPTTAQ
jgi:hypothetical protein